ncbi:MAG: hypothetical protein IAE95_05300 [Chitinophagaceae bacterium]|nr:hypothetical protein [Chitinophagaceae bacterium]
MLSLWERQEAATGAGVAESVNRNREGQRSGNPVGRFTGVAAASASHKKDG